MRFAGSVVMFSLLAGSFMLSAHAQDDAAQPAVRWRMDSCGGIVWDVSSTKNMKHKDHIEMSGRHVSVIVDYYISNQGRIQVKKHVVWPMLRTIPNDTHASLSMDYRNRIFPDLLVDGKDVGTGRVQTIRHAGLMTIVLRLSDDIELTRTIFPSTTQPAVIENCVLRNTGDQAHKVSVGTLNEQHITKKSKGVYGAYAMNAVCTNPSETELTPGESMAFGVVITGRMADDPTLQLDLAAEEQARARFVASLWDKLIFTCPDPVLERAFAFAKVRAAESIFATRGGLMHGPGGGSYYAAIWANDQAEYANPFFAYLGDPGGSESSINSYKHFARFMNDAYKPIPSSIIAEGVDIWHGAGDRGDGAMIAYGASRFALAYGDRKAAEELWPLIAWCLEFCNRKLTKEGVVASDSDELENRFPAGDANLCTSSLYYDALLSGACLAEELGKGTDVAAQYRQQAKALAAAIESHFGANVEDYPTYQYYDGNDVLRAWICIPLTVGLFERAAGTIDALFSPRLWTDDGLASQAGDKTFWDRSTLYGMRGVFAAGATERCMPYFKAYSRRRLLGDHVPYPVEAYPEGNKRHLSAESALYCRVVTEGLFGIRPVGLRAFTMTPRLPKAWDSMALNKMHAFGQVFDVAVTRADQGVMVTVSKQGRPVTKKTIAAGDTATITLAD